MRILIAVSDDEPSQDAVEFARRLLAETHDQHDVLVLDVATWALDTYLIASPMSAFPPANLDEQQQAVDAHAEEVATDAAEALEHPAEAVVVRGDPGRAICDVAEEQGIDLIILGTHDRGAFGRLWFGSVSEYVVRHAPCPVLVVRS